MNDYIAGLTSDLNFSGVGNPGRCYVLDSNDETIISYVNVPYWSPTAPGNTGSNTFQIVLNKLDSTITVHYQNISGTTQNNYLLIGIESVAGSIGLQHSADTYPPSYSAIRLYMPPSSTLDIIDATVAYNTAPGNHVIEVKENPSAVAYSFNRLTNYCGKWIHHCGWYPDTKTRLFKRGERTWSGEIHESLCFPPDQVI